MSSSNVFKPPVKNGVGSSTVGVPANTSLPAIDFLASKFSAISLEVWQQRFKGGEIFNAAGRIMAPQDSLHKETHLHYYRSILNEPQLPFKAGIIFQDDYLVVADKPHFMPVTPGGRYVQQSLLVQLKQELNLPDLSPIHRIDRETAGLVVFSVRAQDRNVYQELFRLRQVMKTYEAIAGAPETSALKPQFPLVHRSRMVKDAQFFRMRELPASKCFQTIHYNSETWIDLIELLEDNDSEAPTREIPKRALARYTLKPVTGHRHQLRLHMSALGLPMLSDQFYPFVRRSSMDEEDFKEPLQLLAKKIAFTDPLTGDKREFKSKLKLRY